VSEQYGVTPTGVNIKRLDVVLDEIHSDLSEQWGFNTRQNPQSFINVLITDFADKVAALWEFGQEIYNSMYPYSAEDFSLDNSVQFGGITRKEACPTIYPVHVECVDGTIVPARMVIKSSTMPEVILTATVGKEINRNSFNRVKVRLAVTEPSEIYSLALNGALYSYTSTEDDTETDIINSLASAISSEDFSVSVDGETVVIKAVDLTSENVLVLSSNLTTASVTGIMNFQTEDNGAIVLPNGTINVIVTVIPGLLDVVNISGHTPGNLRETDAELRKSYADKIFNRSMNMRDSIRSALLQDVQGVMSCVVFENETDETDSEGRYPHSVEVVVDGGESFLIAQTIFKKKAAGINTYGSEEVVIDVNGEQISVRFNRPQYVYVWFSVEVTINPGVQLPLNYVELIRKSIKAQMNTLDSGINVVQQKYNADIYNAVPGIGYIEIPVWYTTDSGASPTEYTEKYIVLSARQKAVTDDTRIEVVLVD
jgi:uncharacterized phage protein gp47/JayE